MVPPKPPAKSAPRPAGSGSAPAPISVFEAMKKEGKLAKNMAKAKKVVAVREFDGPDGDYIANLSRVSHYKKDGALGIIFEFRATEDGEYQGQKMVIFTIFKANEYRTIEEIQNEFFEMLQLMGIDTDSDDDQLQAALTNIINSKAEITLRVKTSKKGSKFINVVGLASAAKEVEATEYVEESVEEVPEEVEEEAVVEEEEAEEEWDEIEEEEVVEEEADTSLPTSWIGYAMLYKGTEVEVVAADNNTLKCTISANGKKLIVPFSALSPPAE